MIIRYSAKLAKKLKEIPNEPMPLDPNPFLDWSGHLFSAERTQFIIMVNTASLYSTVMYGRGITDFSEFMRYWPGFLRDTMKHDGLQMIYDRIVGPAMGKFTPSKALNKSVTASINNLVENAKVDLIYHELSPLDVAGKLNTIVRPTDKGLLRTKEIFAGMKL
ncbi:hypothetical protein SAMN02745216_03003 [Desulfatibacillum alkenivorans DSM 16219]|jgi:hypothetical protein|uniref:DUF6933 domain-containing protein n=1 Tax=Desulfatibacillum alkenivorans DSM 16219 TaxID=1121393 RepID=A0A1M6Q9M5_9BACT|nr:hypothetical protein [Desulfatibacillum alkenivorans]SHK16793.1 hypothetical protein SAMN02745216_03003 [Desulfatibacillum alkenivorans DSM 16219]